MAVLLNPPIGNPSGSIGGLTFSNRGNKCIVCRKRNQSAPTIANVAKSQNALASYSGSWSHKLGKSKEFWNNYAKQSGYESGYNWYIHACLSAIAVNNNFFYSADGLASDAFNPLHVNDFLSGIDPIYSPCNPVDDSYQPLALDPFQVEFSSDYDAFQIYIQSVGGHQYFGWLRIQACIFSLIVRFEWTFAGRNYVYNVGSVSQMSFAANDYQHQFRLFLTDSNTNFLKMNLPHNTLVTCRFLLFNFIGGMSQNNINTYQFYS